MSTFEKIGKGATGVLALGAVGIGALLLLKNRKVEPQPEIEPSTYIPPPIDISKQPIIKQAPLNVSLVSLSQFMQYNASEVNAYLSNLEAQLGNRLSVDASRLPELSVYEGYVDSQKLTVENLAAQKTRLESNVANAEKEKQAAYTALQPLKSVLAQLDQLAQLYNTGRVNSENWRVKQSLELVWTTNPTNYKSMVLEPQITPLENLIPAANTRGHLKDYIDFYWFADISTTDAMLIEGNMVDLQENVEAYRYNYYAEYVFSKESLYNTKANEFQKASDDLAAFLRDQYTPALTQLTAYQNQYTDLKNALYVSLKVIG